jgi:LysM repeat protein
MMVSKQVLSLRRPLSRAGLAVAAALLGACASLGGSPAPDAGRPTTTAPRSTAPRATGPATVTEAAIAGSPAGRASAPAPDAAQGVEGAVVLSASAPAEYVVKRGDTLWDISAMYLRDPWRWPEIWQVNPQVKNPHLIYPGDLLTLVQGANGEPQVRLTRNGGTRTDAGRAAGDSLRIEPLLRASEYDGAIATIPYSAIAAFLERPSVLSREQIRKAPRIVAFRDNHMIGGFGIDAYVRGLASGAANQRFSVVHIGEAIKDPDDGAVIGYQGIYTATAVILTPGEVSKAALTDTARETLEGDRLVALESDIPLNFVPRPPAGKVEGRIVSVVDGVELIGQFKVVAINRGRRHGLEPGNVLAIQEAGIVTRDRTRNNEGGVRASRAFSSKLQLPDERIGTLLVFRTFDRMSYGLIVGTSNPIRVLDVVRTP